VSQFLHADGLQHITVGCVILDHSQVGIETLGVRTNLEDLLDNPAAIVLSFQLAAFSP
jgi:hypothetical protein